MKGKILDIGVISGDDNNRYTFELEDIKNMKGEVSSLINSEE